MKQINKIRVNNFNGMVEYKDEGETLTKKIQRIMDENEPLKDGAPLIYTPKQAGVRADCDIRTDKWDIAMKAMNRVNEYKLSEYLKDGTTETPNQKDGSEGVTTEPNLHIGTYDELKDQIPGGIQLDEFVQVS